MIIVKWFCFPSVSMYGCVSSFLSVTWTLGVGSWPAVKSHIIYIASHYIWATSFAALIFLDKSRKSCCSFFLPQPLCPFCYSSVKKPGLKKPKVPNELRCSKALPGGEGRRGVRLALGPAVFVKDGSIVKEFSTLCGENW